MTITLLLPDAHWNKKARENTITQLNKILQTHPKLQTRIQTLIENINKIQTIKDIQDVNQEIKKMNTTLDQITNKGYEELKQVDTPVKKRNKFFKWMIYPVTAAYITLAAAVGIHATTPHEARAEDLPVSVQRGNRIINPETGEVSFKRENRIYNDKGELTHTTNQEGNIQYNYPNGKITRIIRNQNPPQPQYQQNNETQIYKTKTIEPKTAAEYLTLADQLIKQKAPPQEIITQYESALKITPENDDKTKEKIYNMLGNLYYGRDNKKAREAYKQYYKYHPTQPLKELITNLERK